MASTPPAASLSDEAPLACLFPSSRYFERLWAMAMGILRGCAGLGLGMCLALGCSSSSEGTSGPLPDAGRVDAESDAAAAPDATPEAGSIAAFNGNCKTARWVDVSDACWSCYCSTCEMQLDQCGAGCVKGIQCATDNKVLVGVEADLECESRAFTAACDTDPVIMQAASALYAFDACLITSHDPAKDMIRSCEAECGTTYTGDVCQRFPAPDGGAPDGG
jgi:hypothetical protein